VFSFLASANFEPQIKVIKEIPELPITLNETKEILLNEYFEGFNLEFSVSPEFQSFISVPSKLELIAKGASLVPKEALPKQGFMESFPNGSWKSMNVLGQNGILYVADLESQTSVPRFSKQIPFGKPLLETCFNLIKITSDIVLIDCSEKTYLKNIFYFVNLTDGHVKSQENQLFVITEIKGRNLRIFATSDGIQYILRCSFHNQVGEAASNNTYIEVFRLFSDPTSLELTSIIDRTNFLADSFSISDLAIFNEKIFVLEKSNALYRIKLSKEFQISYSKLSLSRDTNKILLWLLNNRNPTIEQFESIRIVLANDREFIEIDWTEPDKPLFLMRYATSYFDPIYKFYMDNDLWITHHYLNENNSYLEICPKQTKIIDNAFQIINLQDFTNSTFEYNPLDRHFLIINDTYSELYRINEHKLIISPKDVAPGLQNFNLKIISSEPLSSEKIEKNFLITLRILNENDTEIYTTATGRKMNFKCVFPGDCTIPIYEYFAGHNLAYSSPSGSIANQSKRIVKIDEFSLDFLNIEPWRSPVYHLGISSKEN